MIDTVAAGALWTELERSDDALIHVVTDPPYSAKTHSGHNAAKSADSSVRRGLGYAALTPGQVFRVGSRLVQMATGWIVVFSDHVLIPYWERALAQSGRYVFAGLPVVIPGMTVRLTGDGPSREAVYVTCSRPKSLSAWRTLPGYYSCPRDSQRGAQTPVIGAKPLGLMRALVRDYSRPGDLVLDPFAGGGTTILGAVMEGRRGLGFEIDAATYSTAVQRLSGGHQVGFPEFDRQQPPGDTQR